MTKKILFIFFGFILSSSFCFAAETVTITTYYPAPYGVYQQLRLNATDSINPAAACTNKGEMFYHNTNNKLYVCNGSIWVASGASYWSQSGSDIYTTDTTWQVGIGNAAPVFRLQLGDSVNGLDGGILATGSDGDGTTDIWNDAWPENPYFIWYPEKGAFRVGHRGTYAPSGVDGWDLVNIGLNSIGMGNEPAAIGTDSVAIGTFTRATGNNSLAIGRLADATSENSFVLGHLLTSSATNAIAMGAGITSGSTRLVNNTANSLMVGFQSDVSTFYVGPGSGTAGSLGNVGVGTTSPATRLEVNGNVRVVGTQQMRSNNTINFYNTANSSYGTATIRIAGSGGTCTNACSTMNKTCVLAAPSGAAPAACSTTVNSLGSCLCY
ncbi:MAG TPA: hypothetical protein PLC32_05850 [Candidatus Omnitrophota bacterium]|nr:hypothetical protein [Candidatus Omnitrophota bacterium]